MSKFILSLAIGVAAVAAVPGCVENAPQPGAATADPSRPTPPPLASEPVGVQLTRLDPRLAGLPFRVLLDFERDTDLAFLAHRPAAQRRSADAAHTGRSSLALAPAAPATVKLPALVSGAFPGQWTVAGAYVRTAGPAKITVAYRLPSSGATPIRRTIDAAPNQWAPAFLDLTQADPTGAPVVAGSSEVGHLVFESTAPALLDDVVLINNAKTLESPPSSPGGGDPLAGWTIKQGGFAIVVERPNRFRVTLKTPEASVDGWTNQEASDLRARFTSATGRTWTIYADGRQYQEGEFKPLIPLGDAGRFFAAQHASPAEVTVPPEFGRVDRDTPGDRNNDAYNETRGSYQLAAKGPRFQATLKPNTPVLARPVLEIANLPAGKPLITVEGRLVEKCTRLADGRLLIDLPISIERPTTINVSVK